MTSPPAYATTGRDSTATCAPFAGLLRVSGSTVYRWEAARGPLALRAGQEDALQVLYLEIEKRQTE